MTFTTNLSETRRQAYLQAMGIDSYYPTFDLPGAPARQPYQWQPEELAALAKVNRPVELSHAAATASEPAAQQNTVARAPQAESMQTASSDRTANSSGAEPGQASSALKEVAQTLLNKTPQQHIPKPAEAVAKPEQAAADESQLDNEELHFQLLAIRVSEKLFVLNQIPYVEQARFSSRQTVLLSNILRALKITIPENYEYQSFKWPLKEGSAMGAGKIAASSTLSGYLQQRQQDEGFSQLLVLGKQILPLIKPLAGVTVLGGHSLNEMLAMPVLKADVWARLLPLKNTP